MFFKKKHSFVKKTKTELKELTRILFIDDQEFDLLESIKQEGWRVNHIKDLDKFDNTLLKDAHIICVDVLGIGEKLNYKDGGLGLVKDIKKEYPNKKIILYSSVASHDIFDEAIDLVDRKVHKDGKLYPFLNAIEELSYKVFDWDSSIKDVYYKYKHEFGDDLSLEEFNKKMKKSFNRFNELDTNKIIKIATTSFTIAEKIISLIKLAI